MSPIQVHRSGRGQKRSRSELDALAMGTLTVGEVCELTGRSRVSVRVSLHEAWRDKFVKRVARGTYELTANGRERQVVR